MKIKGGGTEDIFNDRNTKAARALLPVALVKVARRKLAAINAVSTLEQLRIPTSNHLEALKRDRSSQHAIRINDKYRVCFIWTGTEAVNVEITDYH